MIARRKLVFHLVGPVLTRSTAIGGFGVDAPAARLNDGTLYIPGSLALGRIRDAFRTLGMVDARYAGALHAWFGGEDDKKTGMPRRGRIFVSDLRFQEQGGEATRPRVAIDPISGTVLEGAMQTLEAPFAIGEKVTCKGEVRLLGEATEIEAFWPLLRKAAAWITQLGGLRTVGYGTVEQASVGTADIPPASQPIPAATERLRVVLATDDLLCVGERRNDANTYTSSDVIPGGAIKGTLASQILAEHAHAPNAAVDAVDRSSLGIHFSALRFTHAFPVRRPIPGTPVPPRPSRVPWSWSLAPALDPQGAPMKANALYDAARASNPAAAHVIGGKAARFCPDWKPGTWDMAMTRVGWQTPETELRIHTAIDDTLRSAKANQLFAIECTITADHVWVGELDLADVPANQRAAVIVQLHHHLQQGLLGLGRLGSFASVTLLPITTTPLTPAADAYGRLTLTLQSAALLRDPAASGDVTEAYRAAFAALAPASGLRLAAIFIRERLSGADFMARRFFGPHRRYQPYLLTEAGSTFVFDIDPACPQPALDAVAAWERHGLEIPAATLAAYGLQHVVPLWSACPFVRQNGYAEVSSRTRLADDADPPRPLSGPGIEELPPEPGADGGPR